jgi:hypothetical protein
VVSTVPSPGLGPVDAGLPLALSARKGDRHYDAAAVRLSDRIEVTLDGDRLDHIVSYDVPAGLVVRHRRDWQGRMVLERGAPVDEVLTGEVAVRWLRAEARHG